MPKVGWVLARNLARHFGTVDALMAATQEELEEAEGIGPDRAELIAEWFADEENRALVADLRSLGLQFEVGEADRPVEGPLTGSQYVITGTLEGYSREQAKAALEALGAKVSDSVSKKTTGVIVGESPGSKAAKAEKAGVPILGEADLRGAARRSRVAASSLEPASAVDARIVTNGPGPRGPPRTRPGCRSRARRTRPRCGSGPRACRRGRSCPSCPSPGRGAPGGAVLSVPLTPATASEPTNAARIAGSVAPASDARRRARRP